MSSLLTVVVSVGAVPPDQITVPGHVTVYDPDPPWINFKIYVPTEAPVKVNVVEDVREILSTLPADKSTVVAAVGAASACAPAETTLHAVPVYSHVAFIVVSNTCNPVAGEAMAFFWVVVILGNNTPFVVLTISNAADAFGSELVPIETDCGNLEFPVLEVLNA